MIEDHPQECCLNQSGQPLIQTGLQPGHTPRIKKPQNRFNGFLFF